MLTDGAGWATPTERKTAMTTGPAGDAGSPASPGRAGDLAAGRYSLDPAASSVRLRHKTMWGLVTVRGAFGTVRGSGEVAADGSGHGTLVVDAASIDTGNAKRDNHLRSADFFEADRYPEITFEASLIAPTGEGGAQVDGELTVRGIGRKLSFPARYESREPGAVVLTGSAEVDRVLFGMTWNQLGMMKGPATIEVELRFTAEN
jgi:polyisoprenoid-binding protein YceI